MNDISWFAIGLMAAFLTMFGFVPQIIKIVRTKLVRDISFVMLVQTCCGAFLWIVYGIHLDDIIVIGANIVSFTCLIIGMILYFTYRSPKRDLFKIHRNPYPGST